MSQKSIEEKKKDTSFEILESSLHLQTCHLYADNTKHKWKMLQVAFIYNYSFIFLFLSPRRQSTILLTEYLCPSKIPMLKPNMAIFVDGLVRK